MTINILKQTEDLISFEILNFFNNNSIEEYDKLKEKFLVNVENLEFSSKRIVFDISIDSSIFYELNSTINKNIKKKCDKFIKEFLVKYIINCKTSLEKFLDSSNSERNKDSLNGNGFIYFKKINGKNYFYIEKDLFVDFFDKTFVDIFDFLKTNIIRAFLEDEQSSRLCSFKKHYDEIWSDTFSLSVPKKELMVKLTKDDLEQFLLELNYK